MCLPKDFKGQASLVRFSIEHGKTLKKCYTFCRSIRNYLNETTNASLDRFLNALGKDGVFILHNIALNIGDLPARFVKN